jgi:proteasome component ECM29
MADTQAAEAKELSLVGKVEMRIALASSEKKLEDLLKTYLAPLLLKLGSEHVAVRNKASLSFHFLSTHLLRALNAANSGYPFQVISICQHVNTRIKSQYASSSYLSW